MTSKNDLILPTLNIGLDESNHGCTPEIWVAVFSRNPSDLEIRGFKKRKKNYESFIEEIAPRDYRFAYASHDLYERYLGHDLQARIAAALSIPYLEKEFGLVNFIIDGVEPLTYEGQAKKRISNICGFPEDRINLIFGANLDKKMKIVNYADGIARYLLSLKEGERKYHPKRINDKDLERALGRF